jgi:hypothetical protein
MIDQKQTPTEPFFLIVADLDEEFFSVEGPMTDDAPWNLAAGHAQENGRSGVPPGTIVRPRG